MKLLFLLLFMFLIKSIQSKTLLRKYLLVRDHDLDKYGLSQFSVLDSTGKQYLYRLKVSDDDKNLLLIIGYPSQDTLGYVQNEWGSETLNATFEIYNSTMYESTNGTIKKNFNLFTQIYLIESNSENFVMKKKFFSFYHKFYDENQNILAQFRMRFRWLSWSLAKYNLEIFSNKLPDIVYFFLLVISDHRNLYY